ncbi:3-hydroxyisobutyrate dehydrogenase [Motiliproteus sp. SC1-56]|uniref:3-hydroxyisobutyrate dehydrogenase n=1 Tax=Motiliproteus sp. SC1-56 TaxID=2799565 RepID=UPI001A8C913B|nr:3-hydroxyisobutyrate dehydrogenase [Motiliproteus sp. SC1-56]
MSKIAFVGLGNMGGPMAANLVKAGHEVHVFDLSEAALQHAVEAGAVAAPSAVEAAEGVEYLITMLPAGKHVESVLVKQDALLDKVSKECLAIDCSTIDADTARRLGAAAEARGIQFVDAPVSGGIAAAAAGTLAFMVGGSEAGFSRAKPVLECMGKNIFHAGDAGAGQLAKACNNMLLAIHMAGTVEALNMGINNGLDPKVLSEIMLNSSGRNWSLEVYNPVPGVQENSAASRGYEGGFMTDLMCKDLGLAMDASQTSGSPVPMGSAARGLFNLHQAHGNGKLDFSSLLKLYQKGE